MVIRIFSLRASEIFSNWCSDYISTFYLKLDIFSLLFYILYMLFDNTYLICFYLLFGTCYLLLTLYYLLSDNCYWSLKIIDSKIMSPKKMRLWKILGTKRFKKRHVLIQTSPTKVDQYALAHICSAEPSISWIIFVLQ